MRGERGKGGQENDEKRKGERRTGKRGEEKG